MNRGPKLSLTCLYLFPDVVYLLSMLAIEKPYVRFGRIDSLILIAVACHLIAGIWLLRHPEKAIRAIIVVYATALPLVGAELILRARSWPTETPWPPGLKRVSVLGNTMPGNSGEVVFSVNSMGLRGPEVDLNDTDLRVLCLGGSTTECVYVTDEASWPWRLQTLLTERLGKKVFVGNAGVSGQATLHHRYQLEKFALASRFQWVVVLCGINDLARYILQTRTYKEEDVSTDSLRWPMWSASKRLPYEKLRIYRWLSMQLRPADTSHFAVYQDPRGDWLDVVRATRRARVEAGPVLTAPPNDFEQMAEKYRGSLREIVDVARRHGQRLLFITQPTLWRPGLEPELDRLLWQMSDAGPIYSVDALASMMDRFNHVMLEVCAELGVDCLDAAAKLPKTTEVFYDDCHFNTSGSGKLASLVADYLAERVTKKYPAPFDPR